MTSNYATLLLTRQMFCGAAVATLIGLGLGAWMTPTLRSHDPDPYANFTVPAPTQPAGGYDVGASTVSWPMSQTPAQLAPAMWRSKRADVEEAQPAADVEPTVTQRIDWEGLPDAGAPADERVSPGAQEPSAQGGEQDADGRDGPPGPLQQ